MCSTDDPKTTPETFSAHRDEHSKYDVRIRWTYPLESLSRLSGGDTIGRAENATIVLTEPGASRYHAKISREGPILTIRDCGSKNGTFINGKRVEHAALSPGQLLRVGGRLGLVERERAGEADGEALPLPLGMIGGETWRRALQPLWRVAHTKLPTVLFGETGTGKEVVARCLHEWSGRQGAFVAINCAAIPEELAESEFFGFVRGAFSGASRDQVGHFRAAHRGTLFLDELQELSLPIQAKLLRVIQEQEVIAVGTEQAVDVDVRMVVAGQAPLGQAVTAGRFREDLYMRLQGVEIALPPLRERTEDIPAAFQHFVSKEGHGAGIEIAVLEALCLYSWPGNVREVEMMARRCAALAGTRPITMGLLPEALHTQGAGADAEQEPGATRTRKEDERWRLAEALRGNGGNLTRACAAVGISRQRGYRLLEGQSVEEFCG